MKKGRGRWIVSSYLLLLVLLLKWRWLLLLVVQGHLTVLRAHCGLAPKTIKQTFKTFRRHVL